RFRAWAPVISFEWCQNNSKLTKRQHSAGLLLSAFSTYPCKLARPVRPIRTQGVLMRIGVICDSHGLRRREALAGLEGRERIIHAGDIGKPQGLTAWQAIARLDVIRGNIDKGDWTEGLPERLELDHGGVRLYVLHDLKPLDFDPAARGIGVEISGHSHKPGIE